MVAPIAASTSDVIVVGGGIIGCAVAHALARERVSVTLLERDVVAAHASGAAAGMLLPVGEATGPGPFLEWGLRSLELYAELVPELREHSGVDPEYRVSGALYVAATEDRARVLRERPVLVKEDGLEWLDAKSARGAEPALAPEVCGALWSPREGHVRSPLMVRALACAAELLGARIESGVRVNGLERQGSRVTGVHTSAGGFSAEHVIVCTGAWASSCAGWLDADWKLPVEPVRGQALSLAASRPPLHSIVAGESVYLVPRRDATVTVGATQERVGFACEVTARGVGE